MGKKYVKQDYRITNKILAIIVYLAFIITLTQYFFTRYLTIFPQWFSKLDDVLVIGLFLYSIISRRILNILIKNDNNKIVFFALYISLYSFIINGLKIVEYGSVILDFLKFFILLIIIECFIENKKNIINILGIIIVSGTIIAGYQFITFRPNYSVGSRISQLDSGVGFFGYGAANNFSIFNVISYYIFTISNISRNKKAIYSLFSIMGMAIGCSKMAIFLFIILNLFNIIKGIKSNPKASMINIFVLFILISIMSNYFPDEFNSIKNLKNVIEGQKESQSNGRLFWIKEDYGITAKTIIIGDGPGQIVSNTANRVKSKKYMELMGIRGDNFGSAYESDLITIFLEFGLLFTILIYSFFIKEIRDSKSFSGIIFLLVISISSRVFQAQFTAFAIALLLAIIREDKIELENDLYN